MRILVTGATGRVGSRVVPRIARWATPRALVRDADRAAALWDRGVEVVAGDLRDPDALKQAVTGVDAVLHVAAAFRGVDAPETFAVNRDATIALARAALDAGVSRFVFASTTLVYGPGRGRPAREDDEPAPGFAYPASKAEAERALLDLHHGSGLGLRIVRLAFVYGDGDPHLEEWLPRAASGPGYRRMQMVHHADVAVGLGLALRSPVGDGRVYNLADDAPLTAWELCELSGVRHPGVLEPAAGDEDHWAGIADTRRVRDEWGYRPVYPTAYTAAHAGAL